MVVSADSDVGSAVYLIWGCGSGQGEPAAKVMRIPANLDSNPGQTLSYKKLNF